VAICTVAALINVSRADAGTIRAKSPAVKDVNSAVASAHDGDTVIVPKGTASWTETLSITKSITLQGANVNATDDSTVIVDDIPLIGENKTAHIISATVKPSQSLRLTGFTFRNGSRPSGQEGKPGSDSSAIVILDSRNQKAPVTSLRIDHCHFDSLRQAGIRILGWYYGVIDHNQWDTPSAGNVASINVSAPTWGGGMHAQGNGSWADPPHFGTDKFVFIENNV